MDETFIDQLLRELTKPPEWQPQHWTDLMLPPK